MLELAARVNQLEHEADRVHQDAIVELFDQERDPIAVIKWKEIFDFLEAATDRCEDVAQPARRRRRQARLSAWIPRCSQSWR